MKVAEEEQVQNGILRTAALEDKMHQEDAARRQPDVMPVFKSKPAHAQRKMDHQGPSMNGPDGESSPRSQAFHLHLPIKQELEHQLAVTSPVAFH